MGIWHYQSYLFKYSLLFFSSLNISLQFRLHFYDEFHRVQIKSCIFKKKEKKNEHFNYKNSINQ